MYDTVYCFYPLPVPTELEGLNVDLTKEDFQTKCLDCSLSLYHITTEGVLVEKVIEYNHIEYTTEEREAMPDTIRPWNTHRSVEKARYDKIINHHGTLDFYSSINISDSEDLWLTYRAYFTYGKLDKIEIVEQYTTKSSELYNAEWEIARAERQKKLWYRFKALVGPYGWRWFWRKIASGLAKTAELTNKIMYFIYREII